MIGLLLWGISLAATLAPELVFWCGVWAVAGGFGLGVPTGAVYHLLLYRSLQRVDALPERWWLRPTTLHDRIPGEDRGAVLAWCYVGAAGFMVIVFGIVLACVGSYRLLTQGI